jgi:hypothetical protein
VKKSLFHFSRKSLKVKKVKSESDYFSRSNVWIWVNTQVIETYLKFNSKQTTDFVS